MRMLFGMLALLAAASLSYADVAIYNGVQTRKTTSLSGSTAVSERIYEVIDLNTAQMVVVTLAVERTRKTFSIAPAAVVVKTEVRDNRAPTRVFTLLAQGGTSTDAGTGVTTVTSFFQSGINVPVILKTGVKGSVPRTLAGNASVVETAGLDAGVVVPPVQVSATASLALLEPLSRQANDAGDTLAAAVLRLKVLLVAQGWVEVP